MSHNPTREETRIERVAALVAEYEVTPNMAELARRYNVTRERIRQRLKRAGVDLSKARNRAKAWQKQNRQELKK